MITYDESSCRKLPRVKVLQSLRNRTTGGSYYCLNAQSRTRNLITNTFVIHTHICDSVSQFGYPEQKSSVRDPYENNFPYVEFNS